MCEIASARIGNILTVALGWHRRALLGITILLRFVLIPDNAFIVMAGIIIREG